MKNKLPNHLRESIQVIGREIRYFDEIDSTNEEAKRLARIGEAEGLVIVADKQTAGKGRVGRIWDSPSDGNIFMSILLRPQISPDKASQLTLIAGLAMCEVIREITNLDAQIKWPNDIVINGKKVCGILTEMSAAVEGIKYIVVGIGVNVNNTNFPGNLPHATSLRCESKMEYSRQEIIKGFFEKFESYYLDYKLNSNLKMCLPSYKRYCITLADKVKIIDSIKEYIATPLDITDDGSLVIRTETGEEKCILSGEVSVRGVYGYI